jgi:hypothetical protein
MKRVLSSIEFKEFIDEALSTDKNDSANIGIVEAETRKKIKDISGDAVSHIEVDMGHIRHSINKKEHNLDSGDLLHSVYAINHATEIKLSEKDNKGSKVLEFKADINGDIYFIESIHNKGDGFLSLITCYRQKKSRQRPDAAKGPPKLTSKT